MCNRLTVISAVTGDGSNSEYRVIYVANLTQLADQDGGYSPCVWPVPTAILDPVRCGVKGFFTERLVHVLNKRQLLSKF